MSEPDRFTPMTDAEPQPSVRPGRVKAQLAPETVRLYAGDWARFAQFCSEQRRPALPAAVELVAAFLAAPGPGPTALTRRLAAIDQRHRASGLPPPGEDPVLRATLKQARRRAPRRPRRQAISAAQLQLLARSCPGDLAGRRDRALLLLAAAGLGRTGLVGLQAEQIAFTEHGLTLTIADPNGARRVLRIDRADAPPICPARALEDWLRTSGTRYGPVFRKVDRWGNVEHRGLGADAIRVILARRSATGLT